MVGADAEVKFGSWDPILERLIGMSQQDLTLSPIPHSVCKVLSTLCQMAYLPSEHGTPMLQSMSLKAELEALRGNLRRAGKLVAAGVVEGGGLRGPEAVQALCNMGCIQHCEGKHRSALFCYSKALDAAAGMRYQLWPAVNFQAYDREWGG